MTDDQFERIKKGLNFYSEGGVYNLCTLTETALREIIEDAVKFYEKQQKIDALHIMELQKQNGELTDELAKKADTNHQLVEQMAKLSEENAELKQANEGKVVEHFEAYGQCRDSRRIAELEAENERLTVSYETLKLHDEEEIGMLKSENAELKDDNKVMADNYSKMEQKFYDNLTKAKKIIQRLVTKLYKYTRFTDDVLAEAEQFIKDSEVEK